MFIMGNNFIMDHTQDPITNLPNEGPGKKFQQFIFIVTFFTILISINGVLLRWGQLEVIKYTGWMARDYDRAFHLIKGDYIPLAGPEAHNGGRLLGPFLYFWLAIPLLINKSYDAINFFNFLLNIFSIGLFFFVLKKYLSLEIALFGTLLLTTNVMHIDMVAFPINPSFVFPFLVLILGLTFEFTFNKNSKCFPWIFLLVSLSIQMHFSVASLYLIPLILAFIFKIRIPRKTFFFTIFLQIICFLPYFLLSFLGFRFLFFVICCYGRGIFYNTASTRLYLLR